MTDVEGMLAILVVLVFLLGWAVRCYYKLYDKCWKISELLRLSRRKSIWLEAELRSAKMLKKPEVIKRWEPS